MKANSVRLSLVLGEVQLSKGRPATAFEPTDVPPWLLASLAGGLAFSVAAILVSLAIAFPVSLIPSPRGPLQPLPPAPRLQTAPAIDLARYQQVERAKLGSYRLTPDGHVQVPIQVAMRAVAARGWSNKQ